MPDSQSPPNPDLNAKIVTARELFRRTGILHDLQKANLHFWPAMAVPHLKLKDIRIKIDTGSVTYQFVANKKAKAPKNFSVRLKELAKNTQFLLGSDLDVSVRAGKKVIFKLKRSSPFVKAPEFTGTDFEAGRIVPEKPWEFPKTPPSKS